MIESTSGVGQSRAGVRSATGVRRVLAISAVCCLLAATVAASRTLHSWQLLLPVVGMSALVVVASLAPGGAPFRVLDLFLAIALVQGCVVPTLEMMSPPPPLGRTTATMNGAMTAALVYTAFATAVVLGWFSRSRMRGREGPAPAPQVGPGLALTLVMLGFVGLFIRLGGGPGRLLSTDWLNGTEAWGPLGALGTITAPLLAVGVFFLLDRPMNALGRLLLAMILVPFGIAALLTFALNRAALLVPIYAMVLTHFRTREQVKGFGRTVILVGIASALLFVGLGQFRTSLQHDSAGYEGDQASNIEFARDSLRIYFQTPMIVGQLYDADAAFTPGSLVASVLAPVPMLGESFRDDNGTVRYNRMLYGDGSAEDQILPLWAEAERSLGLLMMLILGVALGRHMARVDNALTNARDPVAFYALVFWGLWLAQIPIISFIVLTQIALFFASPLFLIALLRARRRSEEAAHTKLAVSWTAEARRHGRHLFPG